VIDADIRTRILERARRAGVRLGDREHAALTEYCRILQSWNRRMNLTSLPIDPPTDAAIDRLFIEPLAAADALRLAAPRSTAVRWIDVGSGGGSPAVPMRLVASTVELTMVEARARKCAFLREIVRVLELNRTEVWNGRIEEVAKTRESAVDLVTIRGVRVDSAMVDALACILTNGGRLAAFKPSSDVGQLRGLAVGEVIPLPGAGSQNSWLQVFERVPRGT
jgi:16S rRNA (guanine527-N7)-methyltransferase